jgi:hypothetical protein
MALNHQDVQVLNRQSGHQEAARLIELGLALLHDSGGEQMCISAVVSLAFSRYREAEQDGGLFKDHPAIRG